jgi:ABC-type methionine transport system permease subunit
MQASLPQDLVPLGATNLLMIISTSCAIFLAIGQAVFQERLVTNLAEVVPPNTIDKIISVGVTNLRDVVTNVDLPKVLAAYSNSVTEVFVSRLPSCVCYN